MRHAAALVLQETLARMRVSFDDSAVGRGMPVIMRLRVFVSARLRVVVRMLVTMIVRAPVIMGMVMIMALVMVGNALSHRRLLAGLQTEDFRAGLVAGSAMSAQSRSPLPGPST